MCLLNIHISSFVKSLFRPFVNFVRWVIFVFYCWVVKSLYILEAKPLSIYDLKLFALILWAVFTFSWYCSLKPSSFTLIKPNLSIYLLLLVLSVLYLGNHHLIQSHDNFVYVFFKSLLALDTTFISSIHFKLILLIVYLGIQFHSFACGYLIVPAQFVENTVLSTLNCLNTFVENQMAINSMAYF